MRPEILLIEDDPLQSETIASVIRENHPNFNVNCYETERAFRDQVDRILLNDAPVPRLVVCDVMLPWDYSSPGLDAQSVPLDVTCGTYRKAGIRCWKYFRQADSLRAVPWIYLTIVDFKVIESERGMDVLTGYVPKDGNLKAFEKMIEDFLELDQEGWADTDRG